MPSLQTLSVLHGLSFTGQFILIHVECFKQKGDCASLKVVVLVLGGSMLVSNRGVIVHDEVPVEKLKRPLRLS